MADKDLDNLEEKDNFKSDDGYSEIEGPTGKEAKKRKADKDTGDPGEQKQGSTDEKTPNTEEGTSNPSLITKMVREMNKMDSEQLQKVYENLMKEEDDDDENEDDDKPKKKVKKVSSDDVDADKEMEEMFSNDELSEDFKKRAKTVFETAVANKVNEMLDSIQIDESAELEALTESQEQQMAEKLDNYLDYVVNEWVEDNKLAIEKGIHAELVESFMSGLKDLFNEHYIDVPEEKVDVVEELMNKNEQLEEKLNKIEEKNVEYFNELKEHKKQDVLDQLSEDLTETQVDKLTSLAESIDFKNTEDYYNSVSIIKENYFGSSNDDNDTKTLVEDDNSNDSTPLEEDVEEVVYEEPQMKGYMDFLNRQVNQG